MHTMLHDRGQLMGVGVAVTEEVAYVILDVAAYWGDAGLTAQPTTARLRGQRGHAICGFAVYRSGADRLARIGRFDFAPRHVWPVAVADRPSLQGGC